MALQTYWDKYYDNCSNEIYPGSTDSYPQVSIYDECVFAPENVQTEGHKSVVYHHLYHQFKLREHIDNPDSEIMLPTQQMVLYEGLPGVDKSWVIKSMQNITHGLYSISYGMVATPTGWSAFQIDRSTHCRKHNIPAGK